MSYRGFVKEYLPVPEEEKPCISLEELFEIWNRIIIPRYSKKLEETIPEIRRYRPYVAHNLENFEKAVKAWCIGLQRSRYRGVGIWEGIVEVFGYRHPYFYYYMRWLGMIATSRDIAAFIGRRPGPEREEGYLYFLIKVYFTGGYEAKKPFEYQIENSLVYPFEYHEDEKLLCLDEGKLRSISFNALEVSELEENFVDTLITYYDVYGIKIDFTAFSWGFERHEQSRYCYLGVQKQNLYGGYWIYEYYFWYRREPYPGTDIEWVSNVSGGPTWYRRYTCYAPVEVRASIVFELTGKEWVEEEAEEMIKRYRRRQEETAPIIRVFGYAERRE